MHYLGKNLRYLRKQLSKTQSEIASLIKKGQTTIGNWENGISEPSLDELLVISNFFDIPLDALIKVDLAEAGMAHRQATTAVTAYDHTAEASPVVREDDRLSYVLQEIKTLREEMEKLHARIK
jgi:transcriptional regulator with XRE-family HTH domain